MKKYFKYLWYLLKHKWYVMIECFRVGLYYQGIMHDMSKFLPREYIPYAKYFYGNDTDRKSFSIAWLKHQKINPHHWQYWILINDSGTTDYLDIPDKYIKEMICDWVGAGKAQGHFSPKDDRYFETRTWFVKNIINMRINNNTINKIKSLLGFV